MNLKYFITAFATFASISVVQGASLIVAQKLKQSISSAIPSKASFFLNRLAIVYLKLYKRIFLVLRIIKRVGLLS